MISIRKIGVVGRTYRNLNRYRQILTVLFKYGFDDIVELLKIDQYIEIGLQVISRKRGERVERGPGQPFGGPGYAFSFGPAAVIRNEIRSGETGADPRTRRMTSRS